MSNVKWTWPPPGVRPEAYEASEAICRTAIERSGTDTCSLAFSTGKDSVAAMIVMRHFFKQVVPVYWYLVPGLSFVEQSLRYYEQVFGFPIARLPHPNRFYAFSNFAFQSPDRIGVLDWVVAGMLQEDKMFSNSQSGHLYTMDELWGVVREEHGLDKLGKQPGPGAMHATGIRASDSPIRNSLYRKHGGFAPNGLLFYPVITWNLNDIEAVLEATGVKLPCEYQWYGRSFDGLMARYTEPIAKHLPQDYQRILEDFPLADLELFRRYVVAADSDTPIKPMYKFQGRDADDKDSEDTP